MKAIQYWNDFFFKPQSTEGIAVFRIVWCALLFVSYLIDLTNINDFYGPHALLSLKTVREQFDFLHANLFHLFSPGYEAVYVIMAIQGVALVSAALGFYTRTSLSVAFLCLVSIHQRNIWLLGPAELLVRSITLLLICSPCGHSLSIDSLLGRKYVDFRKPRDWAPWALRLIQIQISVIYLWTALYWGSVPVELGLGVLLWVKKTRKAAIVAGIFFHLWMEYALSIPFFQLFMITLLVTFFTEEEFGAFVRSVKSRIVKDKLDWAVRGNNEGL